MKKFKRPRLRKKEAIHKSAVPRITNDTVAEHREEVLSSARKYIYPLQHSKHKIVVLTVSIVLAALVAFFTYATLALYKFQSTSTFLYKATQVVPFPIARQGGRFVAYENYLFEVRRQQHYYENQQKVDFKTDFGKEQLAAWKRHALEKVVNDAYIKRIAKEKNIYVSNRDVEDQITLLRKFNRLGNSDNVLEDVLHEYYGWTRNDFKRYLHSSLLQQKVLETLDTNTKGRADAALAELNNGADFAEVAKKYSDDVITKEKGGIYGFAIQKNNREVRPQTLDAIFKLQPGNISGIVNTGNSLEIYKLVELDGEKAKAAHIAFNFKDMQEYLNDKKDKVPTRTYIKVPQAQSDEPVLPVDN